MAWASSASASEMMTASTSATFISASASSRPIPLTTCRSGVIIRGITIPLRIITAEMLAAYCTHRPAFACSSGLIGIGPARRQGYISMPAGFLSGIRSARSNTPAVARSRFMRWVVSVMSISLVPRLNMMLIALRSFRGSSF